MVKISFKTFNEGNCFCIILIGKGGCVRGGVCKKGGVCKYVRGERFLKVKEFK